MQIKQAFILDVIKNGLSGPEKNSFMYGNTPTEKARLKGCIQNPVPHTYHEIAPPREDRKKAAVISKWLAECKDIEAVEFMTAKMCGQDV